MTLLTCLAVIPILSPVSLSREDSRHSSLQNIFPFFVSRNKQKSFNGSKYTERLKLINNNKFFLRTSNFLLGVTPLGRKRDIEVFFVSMMTLGYLRVGVLQELVKQEDVSLEFPDDIDVIACRRLHETIQAFSPEFQMLLLEQIDRRYCYEGRHKRVHSVSVVYHFFDDSMMIGGSEDICHFESIFCLYNELYRN